MQHRPLWRHASCVSEASQPGSTTAHRVCPEVPETRPWPASTAALGRPASLAGHLGSTAVPGNMHSSQLAPLCTVPSCEQGPRAALTPHAQALGVALVQRGNMGGRTQLSETGQSLLAFCDKALAVCAEAAQVGPGPGLGSLAS